MFSCLLWAALPAAVPWLSLPEAERLALAREPALAAAERRAAGLREQAVAAGALPDPQLRVGLMNVPADGYALDRDPMTQRQIALRQAFPPPGMRSARRSVFEARSAAWTAQARARTREVRRAVRHAWLERHYWQAARAVVEQSRSRFEDLLAATRSLYAAGRRNQHDVLRAQLELGRLDDRLFEIDAQAAAAAAELARWVGGAAGRPLPAHLPDWPVPPPETVLRERLAAHPALAAARAQVAAAEAEAETARAAFRPGWGVELAWGERTARDAMGVERPDLLTLMFTVDLPLFPAGRQTRALQGAEAARDAARLDLAALERALAAQLAAARARWASLDARWALYRDRLLDESRGQREAALAAYRNGLTDFTEVMRAALAELENRLTCEHLAAERAKAFADIDELAGLTEEANDAVE